MKVEQVYQIANNLTKEYIGEEPLLQEDLSNLVDIGSATINLSNLDKYVNSLIDQIGRVVFVNRAYEGKTPSVMMDSMEFGAITEKITYVGLPEAEENKTWNLIDGQSYDQNIFTQPQVAAKFFSKRSTFDIPMSFAERQVKSAFQNAQQLTSFFSMIESTIAKSMTVKQDSIIERAINNAIGETLADTSDSKENRAVNLLSLYKAANPDDSSITASNCITRPEFIRFSIYWMKLQIERMQRISKLFNIAGYERFTPKSLLHVILLSEFEAASTIYLQSDTFHNEFVAMPNAETVPYWQGSGKTYAFSSTSAINIKTASGKEVNQSGILGVMFDREALGVSNLDRRVTTNYNARAEFMNNWYKFDIGMFNDYGEQCVVMYVAD